MTRRAAPPPPDKPAARPGSILTVDQAAQALRAGSVVAAPTETVWGLAAAAQPAAIETLWKARLTGAAERTPLALHLADSAPLAAMLERVVPAGPSPLHRRIIDRLTPGPVLLAIPLAPAKIDEARRILGLSPGIADDGAELLVRIPSHPAARALIAAAATPVVMSSLPGVGAGPPPRSAEEALRFVENAGDPSSVAGAITGDPPMGRASTLIRLLPDGAYDVAREGAYEKRFIAKRLARTLLFVCTGNTCRSPMAEAIARHAFAQRAENPGDIPVVIRSAGTFAGSGGSMSPDAVTALRELGIDPRRHTASQLTRDLLADADAVFALAESHADAAATIDPSAAPRVRLLDPAGRDVPDPVGQPLEAYRQTARRIKDLVEQRLRELQW